jgi:hypothetical protein
MPQVKEEHHFAHLPIHAGACKGHECQGLAHAPGLLSVFVDDFIFYRR